MECCRGKKRIKWQCNKYKIKKWYFSVSVLEQERSSIPKGWWCVVVVGRNQYLKKKSWEYSIVVSCLPIVSGVLGTITIINRTEKSEQCYPSEWGRTLHSASQMIFFKLGECCRRASFNIKKAIIHYGKIIFYNNPMCVLLTYEGLGINFSCLIFMNSQKLKLRTALNTKVNDIGTMFWSECRVAQLQEY